MPVIVISGQPGCGTSTVSRLVSEKLGIGYFSPGKFFKSHGAGKETKAAVDVWRTEKGSSKSFHEEIDRKQQELADKGNIVIDGKLSIRFVKKADLKVWLKAAIEVRAKRITQREEGIDYETALRQLKEKEELERKNFKRIYGFTPSDLEKEADMVIDTSNLTAEQVADKIIEKLTTS
ncbi:MAG: (d)CMP kinase [Candidatus Aenigmatarchaeota archaeon]